MAVRISFCSDNEAVLSWASGASRENETVRIFYEKLCDLFGHKRGVSGGTILTDIRKAGSNDFANTFRERYVQYGEVTIDVADKLRGIFEKVTYEQDDILSCEEFVLEKMEVGASDIEALCEAVRSCGMETAVESGIAKTGQKAVGEAVAFATARYAAQKAAEKAMAEASKRVAQKVAAEVAKRVLTRIMIAANVLLAAWTIIDLAGPAYRKTIPSVTYLAILRRLHAAAMA